MIRLVIVVAVAAGVLLLTWSHQYAFALSLGVGVGAVMFLLGMAKGARLGNARGFGQKAPDVGARIGVAIAAMGIAVEGIRVDSDYPAQFRLFCTACQIVGAIIAITLSARYAAPADSSTPKPKS